MTFTKKELRAYMKELGRKGGSTPSKAKKKAAQANIAKATKDRIAKRKKKQAK